MEKFLTLRATAMPMDLADIDTDPLFPARFLQKPRKRGMQDYLFHDARFTENGEPRAEFILNHPSHAGAQILVGGRNFGCGSSREAAVYALYDYGFRAVIAPGFGDIFYNNCFKNGLLPVVVPPAEAGALCRHIAGHPDALVQINLDRQELTYPDGQVRHFEVDGFRKHCLLNGVDELGFTLSLQPDIAVFEYERARRRPGLEAPR